MSNLTAMVTALAAIAVTSSPIPFKFTEAEASYLATYTKQSNALRNQISAIHMQPDSTERQRKLDELNEQAKVVDDAATPLARAVEARGFWSPETTRDPQIDDTVMLIVSHSGDLELQRQTVLQVGPLVAAHRYQPDSYAALYDRVQMSSDLPQRYGTQMQCVDHKFAPYTLEDADHIEEIRKRAGLMETEAEYVAYYNGMTC